MDAAVGDGRSSSLVFVRFAFGKMSSQVVVVGSKSGRDPPFTPSFTRDNALKLGDTTGKGAPAVLVVDSWPGLRRPPGSRLHAERGALLSPPKPSARDVLVGQPAARTVRSSGAIDASEASLPARYCSLLSSFTKNRKK